MGIYLLDKSLKVEICYEELDCDFEDNICISFIEECPDEERIFRADETNIYLTPDEASELAEALSRAAQASSRANQTSQDG
jgi:hypothetical protein